MRSLLRGNINRLKESISPTISPTVTWDLVRLFLALTVTHNLVPLQLDVDMAYLYGDISQFLYGHRMGSNYLVGIFKKSLYGLKYAGRIWNKLIDENLKVSTLFHWIMILLFTLGEGEKKGLYYCYTWMILFARHQIEKL